MDSMQTDYCMKQGRFEALQIIASGRIHHKLLKMEKFEALTFLQTIRI